MDTTAVALPGIDPTDPTALAGWDLTAIRRYAGVDTPVSEATIALGGEVWEVAILDDGTVASEAGVVALHDSARSALVAVATAVAQMAWPSAPWGQAQRWEGEVRIGY